VGSCVLYQHTLKQEVELRGIGLHSGVAVRMILKPAPPSTGIVLKRSDGASHPPVKVSCEAISRSYLATTIGVNGTGVTTVEHLLAALVGCGVDNVVIDVNGPELPVCDGSAKHYVEKILEAGLEKQQEVRCFCVVKEPVEYAEADAYLKAHPANRLEITYSIEFDHPTIGYQELSWTFDTRNFVSQIAPARTFGFLKDVENLQRMGLAQGGSLDNAIVFDDKGIINREGLRFSDECVRHKILDFLGDLLLLGKPVLGHFRIHKAGHALHHRFLRRLAPRLQKWAVTKVPPEVAKAFQPPLDYDGHIASGEDNSSKIAETTAQ